MKGRSGYTFFQIAVYAFTPMVTLEGIFLWNYHPYREAEGLVRERMGHWTIPRAVATPVPESKSNPIQSNVGVIHMLILVVLHSDDIEDRCLV